MIIAGASALCTVPLTLEIPWITQMKWCSAYDRYSASQDWSRRLHPNPVPYTRCGNRYNTQRHCANCSWRNDLCSDEVNKKYNFNEAIFPGTQGPSVHVIAAKQSALRKHLKNIQTRIVQNAQALCKYRRVGPLRSYRWNRQSSVAGWPVHDWPEKLWRETSWRCSYYCKLRIRFQTIHETIRDKLESVWEFSAATSEDRFWSGKRGNCRNFHQEGVSRLLRKAKSHH